MEQYASYRQGLYAGAVLPGERDVWRTPRFRVFAVVLGLCLVIGFSVLLLLNPLYRSSATLLISAPVAIDQESGDADVQQVAIQREILLGQKLLALTSARMGQSSGGAGLPVSDIRALLQAQPVEGTNLLNLIAEGSDPLMLPVLVSSWVTEYQAMRADDVTRNVGQTKIDLDRQLAQISAQVRGARERLDSFRETHNIVSAEREENEVLSRLRGLNASLNAAMEAEVKARSQLQEAQAAQREGKTVIAPSQLEYVNDLRNRLNAGQAKLAVLRQRYTRDYINLQPELRQIPEEVAALQRELQTIEAAGDRRALEETQQEYERAQRVVQNLKTEFAAGKAEAREVTAVFAEHEALVTDLARLEQLHRDTLARRAQLEARQFDRQAQVTVIADPSSASRVWPDYGRLSLYIAVGSVALAVFCVWLLSWLQGRREQAGITLSGVHIHPGSPGELLGYERAIRESLEHHSERALEDRSRQHDSGKDASENGGDGKDDERKGDSRDRPD
ncbi:hypothetical protein [Pseudomaricurvus sp. HS19]|uniref:GumC family protein n=1 Tax=Pseudomaricurvus sp. HS19 TaxID=2692626 RepID=UPI001371E1A6|nr:hypothetical protein [Pseudomaricurvus sp. HS19]MYM64410.1 hypothetical protein [Pseudomaricurvus sp. HS19]